jgi:hypothetical protein
VEVQNPKACLEGRFDGDLFNFRSALARLGVFGLRQRDTPLLDVGIHNISQRHYKRRRNRTVPVDLKNPILMKPPMPCADFPTTLPSWTRTGAAGAPVRTIIVHQIIKVKPHFVDYLNKDLHPWVQYVPVRHDLSDLIQRVEWALYPANEEVMLDIVHAANECSSSHMTHHAIMLGTLDVLNFYVSYLDRGGVAWPGRWRSCLGRL